MRNLENLYAVQMNILLSYARAFQYYQQASSCVGAFMDHELISNTLRGSVSIVMYVLLLFTLMKSRFGRKGTLLFAVAVFIVNMASTLWFYLNGDLTSLSRFNVLLFVVISIAIKPLTRLSFMQWCFAILTTINIAMMIIILSFHLGKLFPHPEYAHTIIRFVLYLTVILLFKRHLLPSYRSAVDNWPVFSALMLCMFLNLSYYFFVTNDIQETLSIHKWPLLLLVGLCVAGYGTIFHALAKFTTLSALEEETERLHETTLQLERFANHDMLTGLPNRRCFFERLERLVRMSEQERTTFALLYLDLDGFKEINDTHGHEFGDSILVTVGNRLVKSLKETDFVARLGGDEFAVLVEHVEGRHSVQNLVERIQTVMREVVRTDTVACSVDASIGAAIYPDDGIDGENLLRKADVAMYAYKKTKKQESDQGLTLQVSKQVGL